MVSDCDCVSVVFLVVRCCVCCVIVCGVWRYRLICLVVLRMNFLVWLCVGGVFVCVLFWSLCNLLKWVVCCLVVVFSVWICGLVCVLDWLLVFCWLCLWILVSLVVLVVNLVLWNVLCIMLVGLVILVLLVWWV